MLIIQKKIEEKREPKFVSDEDGVVILDVVPYSTAYDLGLREGDPNESYQFLYQFQLKNFNGKDSFSTALAKKPFKAKDKFYGCEKFYKIDDLEKDGFINDEGSLIFIVLLKPENSFELKKEVDYYYNKFEKIKFVEKKK